MSLKISELKTYKTINRKAKSGKYISIDFEFKYNPNVKKFNLRILSKLLDFLFYYGLFFLISAYTDFNMHPVLLALLCLFLINPILETLTGRTFGKLLLGFEVIDDYCNKPSVLRSFAKNKLQFLNLIVYAISEGTAWSEDIYYHNEKTLTYTIWRKEKKTILKMMQNE
ncbi:hypothetical protein Celal_3557 [Cellulophaga algicola DSM 14237]|uniref:RDD domain-containing protein n=1 Tax=Cellulophaga algicola (strain DSM 14237 / IC166 / ACAM 630) TaxID=688270 RepID=E6X8G3_CELAD|nr:RDD family protein [Cellulophaga algicola]ADV50819.1 hypothetical protein Celal_3557 [Cellulophaga algicola DSM 14237]